MAFYVGQKVVCIHAGGWHHMVDAERRAEVEKGGIYTVREILDHDGNAFLRFHETKSGYLADGFRPIVEPKTDISIFTAMLTPKKVTEPA